MDMHQVRYVLAVAEHSDFVRAAQALGIAQASLRRTIEALELELLERLFVDDGALTEFGRTLLPHLQAARAAAEEAEAQARRIRAERDGSPTLGG